MLEFYIIIKSSQWPFEMDTIVTTIFTALEKLGTF